MEYCIGGMVMIGCIQLMTQSCKPEFRFCVSKWQASFNGSSWETLSVIYDNLVVDIN